MKSKQITQKRLKELLNYDPETGIFTWKIYRSSLAKKGDIAGKCNLSGYVRIGIDDKLYYAHRLAFLIMEGYLPENCIDHINKIKNDNRWINLRHVSHQCNNRNCKISKNNQSGVNGVSLNKRDSLWVATITIAKKTVYLGSFKDFWRAVEARWNGELNNNFPNCQTTSSAYLYLKQNQKKEIGDVI